MSMTLPSLTAMLAGLFAALGSGVVLAAGAAAPAVPKAEEAFFNGPITKDAVRAFIATYEAIPLSEIVIMSSGGDAEAGMWFGHWVKDRNLALRVRWFCVSACANYVFPAGREKIIEPWAVVAWHGSMEQRDIREDGVRFDAMLAKRDTSPSTLTPDEATLWENRKKNLVAKRLRAMQARFVAHIGVNEALIRLGQEPTEYPQEFWTVTVGVMAAMGMDRVQAPAQYGTPAYLKHNAFAQMSSPSGMLSFDIDAQGRIFPMEK